jgi:hypothetical protein
MLVGPNRMEMNMSRRYFCSLLLLAGCTSAEDASSTAGHTDNADNADNAVTAPALTVESSGLHGYLYSSLSTPPSDFTYGFSTFAQIYTLNPSLAANTQLGWGTWIQPNNLNFTQPLCPVGTVARGWPDRGPTWSTVYQTMEGGPGQWGSSAFPTIATKFRINSTPDCYNTEVASTGWSFYQGLLPAGKLGLVQLSNRLLTAPDGFTFTGTTQSGLLGYGYLALPIIPARPAVGTQLAVGNQSWTLFLKAANFGGPVAFFAPEGWTQVAATDRTGAGRGLDAQPMFTGGLAVEIGNAPMFTSKDARGTRYRRIPQLTFSANATTRDATLHQQVRYYAKSALWNAVQNWIDNGTAASQMNATGSVAPTITSPGFELTLGDRPIDMNGMISSAVTSVSGGSGWGFHWSTGASRLGALPEYYVETGSGWKAVAASAVPAETGLTAQTFPRAVARSAPALDRSSTSPWAAAKASAGPFTVKLIDGSTVQYVWYRFVDQPAIARLGLSAAVRTKLQAFAESLHTRSGVNGITLAAPSSPLATLDPAQLVTPPAGLEKGYVPVVISQR